MKKDNIAFIRSDKENMPPLKEPILETKDEIIGGISLTDSIIHNIEE